MPKIIITPGEPAGIGPDIVIKLAQKKWPAELIVVADQNLMQERARSLKLTFDLNLIHVPLIQPSVPGILDPRNAQYVLKTLEIATALCLKDKNCALVTGPVNKAVINEAGIPFQGHTEFLAAKSGIDFSLMLFVTEKMKVALATTHIPLAEVPKKITADLLKKTLNLLHYELKSKFKIDSPKILVCGLNPHAGEKGHIGREEIEIIIPALNFLRESGLDIIGPLPADTIFTPQYLTHTDAILALYHDQALPVVKYAGFGKAVNITLGLPFIRTSVDHGTAIDLAGTDKADAASLAAAVELALFLQG